MRGTKATEAQAELEMLGRLYRLQLEAEVSAIQRMANSANAAWASPELLAAVHRLAGSSLTFGYTEFGARLQVVESELRAATAGGQPALQALATLANLQPPTAAEVQFPLSGPEGNDVIAARAEPVKAAARSKRAVLIDPYGWLPPAVESIVEAYGFEAVRAESGEAELEVELLIECTIAPSRSSMCPEGSQLILVCPREGFHERIAAARCNASALLTVPLDIQAFEQRVQSAASSLSTTPFRALLVDDDALALEAYRLGLKANCIEARALTTPSQLFEQMDTFRPDVLVLDINLPECSGLELARAIRFNPQWLQVPILFLSAQLSLELEALTSAGEDFLSKPISSELLSAHIVSRARRSRALASGLSRDGLTGLLCPDDARRRLEAAAAQARMNGRALSIALLDIDHFKRVNDTHGHAAGDMVIRALAALLRNRMRGSDFAGRLGGEEFLLVFEDCSTANARQIVDRMRDDFTQIAFEGPGCRWHCKFSAGIADLQGSETAALMLGRADQALYLAKANGRNRSELSSGPSIR
jgi:diguanylate cyclase (GGDEF)-like protein